MIYYCRGTISAKPYFWFHSPPLPVHTHIYTFSIWSGPKGRSDLPCTTTWSQWSFTVMDEFGPFKQSSVVITKYIWNNPKGILFQIMKQQIRQTDGAVGREEQIVFSLRKRNGKYFHDWAQRSVALEQIFDSNFRAWREVATKKKQMLPTARKRKDFLGMLVPDSAPWPSWWYRAQLANRQNQ